MTRCEHTRCDEPGLQCTRDEHPGRGHTYESSNASELGEGLGHHEPEGDDQ